MTFGNILSFFFAQSNVSPTSITTNSCSIIHSHKLVKYFICSFHLPFLFLTCSVSIKFSKPVKRLLLVEITIDVFVFISIKLLIGSDILFIELTTSSCGIASPQYPIVCYLKQFLFHVCPISFLSRSPFCHSFKETCYLGHSLFPSCERQILYAFFSNYVSQKLQLSLPDSRHMCLLCFKFP